MMLTPHEGVAYKTGTCRKFADADSGKRGLGSEGDSQRVRKHEVSSGLPPLYPLLPFFAEGLCYVKQNRGERVVRYQRAAESDY